ILPPARAPGSLGHTRQCATPRGTSATPARPDRGARSSTRRRVGVGVGVGAGAGGAPGGGAAGPITRAARSAARRPPPRHGPGAVPGPAVPALPRRLHLRQEERHPLRAAPRGHIQSTAILIYLSSKYPTADHWYPSNLQARARIHEYLGWHADCVRGTFGVPLWTQVLAPLIGVHLPEEKVQRNRAAMDRALQELEDKFLRDQAFLTGQHVTLADLMALEELIQPVAVGFDLFEGRPKLTAWRERLEAFLGMDLCQETHGLILNILEQAANKKIPDPAPEVYPYMLLRISRIP
uniref:glutathione transferase n=1 Tax=Canis lupus familiaris TaxID=9615 RepID=A0A8I3PI83_CANLF